MPYIYRTCSTCNLPFVKGEPVHYVYGEGSAKHALCAVMHIPEEVKDPEKVAIRILAALQIKPMRNSELLRQCGYEDHYRPVEDVVWDLVQTGKIVIGPDSKMRIS
jgi:hypothetical protein